MTLRTILVFLKDPETASALCKSAALLARRDNAHVIGLRVAETLHVNPQVAMDIPKATYRDFAESQKKQTAALKEVFESHFPDDDIVSEWREVSTGNATLADRIIESARSADLVIIGQDDEEIDWTITNHLQERVIRDSGRPVLVVPGNRMPETIGSKLVLGWSGTREATRAAHDLRIVAKSDARVRILCIGKAGGDALADFSANDLAAAYARHGLNVDVMHRDKAGHQVAEVLIQEAFEIGADVLVTGAFGHSRTYDFVIGAATRRLLHEAKIPVLFTK